MKFLLPIINIGFLILTALLKMSEGGFMMPIAKLYENKEENMPIINILSSLEHDLFLYTRILGVLSFAMSILILKSNTSNKILSLISCIIALIVCIGTFVIIY